MSKSLKLNFSHLKLFIITFSYSDYSFIQNKLQSVAVTCHQSQIYNYFEVIQNRLKLFAIISNSYCSPYTKLTKIHLHFTEIMLKSLKSNFSHSKSFPITFGYSKYSFIGNNLQSVAVTCH